jgi:uncharacterized RDD family membrane protein YckC
MKHDAQDVRRYLFVSKFMLFTILTSLFFNLKKHLLGDIIFKSWFFKKFEHDNLKWHTQSCVIIFYIC